MPLGTKIVGGLGSATDEDVLEGVTYTSDNGFKRTGTGKSVTVDTSLSVFGAAADAKVTGDNLKALNTAVNGLYPVERNTGEYITVEDSVAANAVIREIDGKTEQFTTTGAQLFDASKLPTTSQGGATVKNNGDGSFTVSGSGELTSYFGVYKVYTHEETVKMLKPGRICAYFGEQTTIPACYFNIVNSTDVMLSLHNMTNNSAVGEITLEMLNDPSSHLEISFYSSSIHTIKPGKVKPMLYQDGDGTYEPYTGGQPSPNPYYPQKIKSIGTLQENGKYAVEVNSCGKNLLGELRVGAFLYANGEYSPTNIYLCSSTLIPVKELTNYLAQCKGSVNPDGVCFYDENKKFINCIMGADNPKKILTPKKCRYIGINFYGKNEALTISDISDAQIEESSTATLYEPYQSSTAIIELDQPLYEGDKIFLEDGALWGHRENGVVTYDGSVDEGWHTGADGGNVHNQFYINNQTFMPRSYFVNDRVTSLAYYEYIAKLPQYKFASTIVNAFSVFTPKSETTISDLTSFKDWLSQNPITVVYKLAEPTKKKIRNLSSQELKSFNSATHIYTTDPLEPTLTVDVAKNQDGAYLLDAYTKSYKNETLNSTIEKLFKLQRTGKVYTVRFPKWETSQSPLGEKLDFNAGLICEPSTNLIKGHDDYENIPLFKTYDVNAYVDDEGIRHVTAIKGDENFRDVGEVDVFVMGMSYYEKYWEDDSYWYYSRTDSPKDGYVPARECINGDGSVQPFALYSKYVSGEINGKPYSSKGLIPKRNKPSYTNNITTYRQRGKYYSGGMMCDYKYIATTFYLKYATLNSQSIINGCFAYSCQYKVKQAEASTTRVILTKAQADAIPIGNYVSIGDPGSNTDLSRNATYMHNIADSVEVLSKTEIDADTVAVNLRVDKPITITGTTYVSSMPFRSGISDKLLGRDGALNNLTAGKSPMVIQGIELAVGGYECSSNAFMDIVNPNTRNVYITNDATKLTSDITAAKTTYVKCSEQITNSVINSWGYITHSFIDTINGSIYPTSAGESGNGSAVGFCDGLYHDSGTSGQREFLLLGSLGDGTICGLSYLHAYGSLATSGWYLLARLSINGVGGELVYD